MKWISVKEKLPEIGEEVIGMETISGRWYANICYVDSIITTQDADGTRTSAMWTTRSYDPAEPLYWSTIDFDALPPPDESEEE